MERLDRLISEIKSKYHAPAMGKSKGEVSKNCDVLIVAHGHILRAFAMRWIQKPLTDTSFLLEAGGVGTLRYADDLSSFCTAAGTGMGWPYLRLTHGPAMSITILTSRPFCWEVDLSLETIRGDQK